MKNGDNAKQKKKMPKWAIVLIVIFVIMFLGALGSDSEENSNETNNNNNNAEQEVIEYIKVDVDELNDALEKNAAVAKETYNGKYLEITGKLSTIDSDLSYISIVSTTDEWDFLGVHCDIKNNETKEVVKTLSKDQTIVVRGKITDVGEVLGYYLDITEIVTE